MLSHTLKVKLIARVSGAEARDVASCLTLDKCRNHVMLDEPSTSCNQRQRAASSGPKLFMFDQVFGADDSLVCTISLIIAQT